MVAVGDLAGSVMQTRRTTSPIIVSQKVFFTDLGYVHLEQETDEGEGLEKGKKCQFWRDSA